MLFTRNELCKLLAKNTRGLLNKDDWNKILKIQAKVTASEILKGNIIRFPIGTFSCITRKNRMVKNFSGEEVLLDQIKTVKYSSPESFKKLLNKEDLDD